jgi:hypothetical protein
MFLCVVSGIRESLGQTALLRARQLEQEQEQRHAEEHAEEVGKSDAAPAPSLSPSSSSHSLHTVVAGADPDVQPRPAAAAAASSLYGSLAALSPWLRQHCFASALIPAVPAAAPHSQAALDYISPAHQPETLDNPLAASATALATAAAAASLQHHVLHLGHTDARGQQQPHARFVDVSPLPFSFLRWRLGWNDWLYRQCLEANIEAVSEQATQGRSGSFFYYTSDQKLIFKSVPWDEALTFLRMIPSYMHHVLVANPDSLLCRYLGFHVLTLHGKDIPIIVMRNILQIDAAIPKTFPAASPRDDAETDANADSEAPPAPARTQYIPISFPFTHIYDLKGSFVNRSVQGHKSAGPYLYSRPDAFLTKVVASRVRNAASQDKPGQECTEIPIPRPEMQISRAFSNGSLIRLSSSSSLGAPAPDAQPVSPLSPARRSGQGQGAEGDSSRVDGSKRDGNDLALALMAPDQPPRTPTRTRSLAAPAPLPPNTPLPSASASAVPLHAPLLRLPRKHMLKDLDLAHPLVLQPAARAALLRVIALDVEWLLALGMTDYSLLVGACYRYLDPTHFNAAMPRAEGADAEPQGMRYQYNPISHVCGGGGDGGIGDGCASASLHPVQDLCLPVAYTFGVVDIFTSFTCAKKAEHHAKVWCCCMPRAGISATDPETYAFRFMRSMEAVLGCAVDPMTVLVPCADSRRPERCLLDYCEGGRRLGSLNTASGSGRARKEADATDGDLESGAGGAGAASSVCGAGMVASAVVGWVEEDDAVDIWESLESRHPTLHYEYPLLFGAHTNAGCDHYIVE